MEKKEELLAIEGLKSERRDLGAKLVTLATEHAAKLEIIKSNNRLCQEKREDIAKLKATCEISQIELTKLTANIQVCICLQWNLCNMVTLRPTSTKGLLLF